MRFLFLDFDGVLNNWDFNAKNGGWALRQSPEGPVCILDPANVAHLNKIVAATDCTVVYSTAHRKGKYPIFRCWESLRHAGATFERPRWTTPDNSHEPKASGGSRGSEIADWLKGWLEVPEQHGFRFVVLDDSADAWPVKPFEDNGLFIQTDLRVGLTEEQAEKAIAWLLQAEPNKEDGRRG